MINHNPTQLTCQINLATSVFLRIQVHMWVYSWSVADVICVVRHTMLVHLCFPNAKRAQLLQPVVRLQHCVRIELVHASAC